MGMTRGTGGQIVGPRPSCTSLGPGMTSAYGLKPCSGRSPSGRFSSACRAVGASPRIRASPHGGTTCCRCSRAVWRVTARTLGTRPPWSLSAAFALRGAGGSRSMTSSRSCTASSYDCGLIGRRRTRRVGTPRRRRRARRLHRRRRRRRRRRCCLRRHSRRRRCARRHPYRRLCRRPCRRRRPPCRRRARRLRRRRRRRHCRHRRMCGVWAPSPPQTLGPRLW